MSSKLTDRQQQVLDCIRECLSHSGMAPTRAEIADIMGFQSKNAASDHLRALERKGYIKLHSDRSRGIQLLDHAYWGEEELPIVGKVAAGVPIEAIENVERTVPVPGPRSGSAARSAEARSCIACAATSVKLPFPMLLLLLLASCACYKWPVRSGHPPWYPHGPSPALPAP